VFGLANGAAMSDFKEGESLDILDVVFEAIPIFKALLS
jgi:hypothetical protein